MTQNHYITLTEKYRPRLLKQLVGQEMTTQMLSGMFASGKIVRTILLSGPYSSGKTTIARIIASYLNCTKYGPKRACTVCDSCVAVGQGTNPDVIELDAATNRGIDQIRAVIEQSKFAPRNNFRNFILDEVHQLTPQACQALLKILEDPPAKSVFTLCTTEPEKLPATVRSRCKEFKLKKISATDCAELISGIATAESFPLSQEDAMVISRYAYGHPRTAIHMLENVIDYVAGDREKKPISEIIPVLTSGTLNMPVEMMAEKYVELLLKGSGAAPIKILDNIDNPVYFLQRTCFILRQLLNSLVAPRSVDAYYGDWIRAMDKTRNISLDDYIRIHSLVVDALDRASKYAVDASEVLYNCTYKIVSAVRKTPLIESKKE